MEPALRVMPMAEGGSNGSFPGGLQDDREVCACCLSDGRIAIPHIPKIMIHLDIYEHHISISCKGLQSPFHDLTQGIGVTYPCFDDMQQGKFCT